jgi:hypothetical protein
MAEETVTEQPKEKVEEEVAEKKEGIAEEIEELEEESEEELDTKSKASVQQRIDSLIAKISSLETQLSSQKEEKKQEKTEKKEPTIEELEAWSTDPDHPEYHSWAIKELAKRYAKAEVDKYKHSAEALTQAQQDTLESISKAQSEFPEIYEGGKESEGWKLADSIYAELELHKVKDGQYIAASMASSRLSKGVEKENKDLKRKAEKLRAKGSLAGSTSAPASASREATKAKLAKEAIESGNWKKYREFTEKNPEKPLYS